MIIIIILSWLNLANVWWERRKESNCGLPSMLGRSSVVFSRVFPVFRSQHDNYAKLQASRFEHIRINSSETVSSKFAVLLADFVVHCNIKPLYYVE